MTGKELRAWRLNMGKTQREFSLWIKPQRTEDLISQWELGKRPIPEWVDTLKEFTDGK